MDGPKVNSCQFEKREEGRKKGREWKEGGREKKRKKDFIFSPTILIINNRSHLLT